MGLMVRVEHVLDNWKTVPQDAATAVEDFPPSEFDFRPAPNVVPATTRRRMAQQAAR